MVRKLNTENEREMMKRMLDERNQIWRIESMRCMGMANGICRVGSFHMFGESGLPALMAKHGYRVERVDLKPL